MNTQPEEIDEKRTHKSNEKNTNIYPTGRESLTASAAAGPPAFAAPWQLEGTKSQNLELESELKPSSLQPASMSDMMPATLLRTDPRARMETPVPVFS